MVRLRLGVFMAAIQHLLVLCTPVEVCQGQDHKVHALAIRVNTRCQCFYMHDLSLPVCIITRVNASACMISA